MQLIEERPQPLVINYPAPSTELAEEQAADDDYSAAEIVDASPVSEPAEVESAGPVSPQELQSADGSERAPAAGNIGVGTTAKPPAPSTAESTVATSKTLENDDDSSATDVETSSAAPAPVDVTQERPFAPTPASEDDFGAGIEAPA
jgi:hypothetical protein